MAILKVRYNSVTGTATPANLSMTWTTAPTAGNLMIVVATVAQSGCTLGCSDTLGNLFLKAHDSVSFSSPPSSTSVFYAMNILGGADTVTISTNATGGTTVQLEMSEWSGVAIVDALEQAAVGNGSSTSCSAGPLFPLHDGNVLQATVVAANTGVTTKDAAWTAGDNPTGFFRTEYLIQTTAASISAPFTLAPTGGWAVFLVVFSATPLGTRLGLLGTG